MTYEEALAYISNMQGRGWRLGLDRMNSFVDRLGLRGFLGDGDRPQFIHVAGTNGKGSVTAYAQAILAAAGLNTGGYFSPYVYDIRERVQYGCKPIQKGELTDLVSMMQPVADSFEGSEYGEITEFEFKTALGFLYWKQKACDWVAIEVGLGGRLDATNVVTPAVSVITSIGLDHMEILGETEGKIAAEKAGIIKARRPVIVGDVGEEALAVIKEVASQLNSPLLHCPRVGEPIAEYNAKLASLAVGAAGVEITEKVRSSAIENVAIPGRYQRHEHNGRLFILDGAHNQPSAKVLAEALRSDYPGKQLVLVTSMLVGHDPTMFYTKFADLFDTVIVTSIDFHRARDAKELANLLRQVFSRVEAIENREAAIARAIDLTSKGSIIVVTGSFYLVGDIGRAIGAHERFMTP